MVTITAATYLSEALVYRGILIGGLTIFPIGVAPPAGWDLTHTYPSGVTVAISGIKETDRAAAHQVLGRLSPVDHERVSPWTIQQRVTTLTAQQLSNVNNDLLTGWPSKLQSDRSERWRDFWQSQWLLQQGAFSAASLDDLKQQTIAMYIDQYPYYLLAPAFDSTIWVSAFTPET